MSKSQEKAVQGEPGKNSDETKSSADLADKEVGDNTTEKKVEAQETPASPPPADLPLVEDTVKPDEVAAHTDICGDCCPCCCIIL
jgi:hypothetical protein